MMLYGDLGVLTADWGGSSPEIRIHRAKGSEDFQVDIPDTTTTAAFVATVLEGAPNLAPARDGAYAVALTEAAYRSAREGGIIRVETPGPA
jgi:hypothetical protein